jgi:hypothetical protein
MNPEQIKDSKINCILPTLVNKNVNSTLSLSFATIRFTLGIKTFEIAVDKDK